MGAKAELKMEATLEATSELGLKAKLGTICKAELKGELHRNQRLNGS